jgi:hypothetical protein
MRSRVIDYWVTHVDLKPAFRFKKIKESSRWRPHSALMVELGRCPRNHHALQLIRPKPFPRLPQDPCAPGWQQAKTQTADWLASMPRRRPLDNETTNHIMNHPDAEPSHTVEAKLEHWARTLEFYHVAALDIPPHAAKKHTGRCPPPRFQLKPSMPRLEPNDLTNPKLMHWGKVAARLREHLTPNNNKTLHRNQLQSLVAHMVQMKWPRPDADEEDITYSHQVLEGWADDISRLQHADPDEIRVSAERLIGEIATSPAKRPPEATTSGNNEFIICYLMIEPFWAGLPNTRSWMRTSILPRIMLNTLPLARRVGQSCGVGAALIFPNRANELHLLCPEAKLEAQSWPELGADRLERL